MNSAGVMMAEPRRASEIGRLRLAFEQAPGFISVLRGPDHIVEFVNRAHQRAFGSEEWLGKPIRDAFPELEGMGYLEHLDRVFQTGETFEARGSRVRYRRSPSGASEARWLDFICAPLVDEAGVVTGVFCDGYDVTDRARAQIALELSERRFRAVQENSLDGFMLFESVRGADGRICDFRWLHVNRAAAQIVGRSAEALIGRRLLEEMPGNREEGLFDLYMRVVETGEPSTREFHYDHEGIDRYFRSVAARIDDGFAVNFSDLTERRRDEQRLRDSEGRFRAAVDAVQGILWTNTASGEMEGEQPGWSGLTGQTPAQYQGYGWATAVHPEDAQPTVEAWQAAVSEKRPFVFEHRVRRADGEWRQFSIRAVPNFGQHGEIKQWVGVHTDVTEQRSAEAALRELTAHLEERVQTASAERAEALARLHEAQKVETLGQLTGGVAHDFNNLLTPIMGGIEILSRKLAHDDRAQRIASGAMQSAERARTLIQRLLSFGRRQTLQSRSVDLGRLVADMRELIERSIGPLIEVVIDISPGLAAVEVDPNQLELALLNLSVNARDAMDGGGRLTISAEALDRDPGGSASFIVLRVADTGRGMDPETLARATEPFFTTKDVGQGTGLGLSMVFGLAAQSGGKLTLTSAVGQGTVAELILPVAATSPAPPAPEILPTPLPCTGGTILLVDDEDLVRTSIAEGLREGGYSVLEAASADSALEHLRAGLRPDVLITDHLMPGTTGSALSREARIGQPGLPVLMITGYANLPTEETRDVEVLAKPFQQSDLVNRVSTLMSRSARA